MWSNWNYGVTLRYNPQCGRRALRIYVQRSYAADWTLLAVGRCVVEPPRRPHAVGPGKSVPMRMFASARRFKPIRGGVTTWADLEKLVAG
jgi:hypothetical protein